MTKGKTGKQFICNCSRCKGKAYKSRETLRLHAAIDKKNGLSPNGAESTPKVTGSTKPKVDACQSQNQIKEFNLKPEADKMTQDINPKSEKGEPKYRCSKCKATFDEIPNFCPGCGVALK